MDDLTNPFYRLGAAHGRLTSCYAKSEAFREYASTADTRSERDHYNRRALKWKAIGIIEHDRLLNFKGLK
jgi:hypothetical protein